MDRWIDGQMNRKIDRWVDWQMGRLIDRQIRLDQFRLDQIRQIDKQIDQIDRQILSQLDRYIANKIRDDKSR